MFGLSKTYKTIEEVKAQLKRCQVELHNCDDECEYFEILEEMEMLDLLLEEMEG